MNNLYLGRIPRTYNTLTIGSYLAQKSYATSKKKVIKQVLKSFKQEREKLNVVHKRALADLEEIFGSKGLDSLVEDITDRLINEYYPAGDYELDEETEIIFKGEEILTVIAIVVTVISIVVTVVAIVVTIVYAPENCGDENPASVPPPEGDDRDCAWVEEEVEVEQDIEIDVDVEVQCTEVIDMESGETIEFRCDDPADFDYDFSDYESDFEFVID